MKTESNRKIRWLLIVASRFLFVLSRKETFVFDLQILLGDFVLKVVLLPLENVDPLMILVQNGLDAGCWNSSINFLWKTLTLSLVWTVKRRKRLPKYPFAKINYFFFFFCDQSRVTTVTSETWTFDTQEIYFARSFFFLFLTYDEGGSECVGVNFWWKLMSNTCYKVCCVPQRGCEDCLKFRVAVKVRALESSGTTTFESAARNITVWNLKQSRIRGRKGKRAMYRIHRRVVQIYIRTLAAIDRENIASQWGIAKRLCDISQIK